MSKIISVWVGVVVFLSASLAQADLRQYAPEANNACPHVSAFSSVILDDARLKCGDTAGFGQMFRKLNGWLPQGTPRPYLALVLSYQDSNAFYAGDSMHVPLWFGYASRDHRFNLFPNDVSRGVVAHEYGHAMLAESLAAKNAVDRQILVLLREYGRLTTMKTIYGSFHERLQALWLKTYEGRFGPRNGWTSAQQEEAQNGWDRMEADYQKDGEEIQTRLDQLDAKMHPAVMKRWDELGHYHEFFADVVAAIDAGDWTITRRVFQALGLPAKDITPRDFTDARNRDEAIEKGGYRFEAHESLGPARFYLWQRMNQNRCLKPNPQVFIPLVIDAIRERVMTPMGHGPGENEYERRGFNRNLINALFRRIDAAGAALCR